MQEAAASASAYRVALRRAAHQIYDSPLVFEDPLALRILGLSAMAKGGDLRAPARPSSRSLRAYLVARARFSEDVLAAAVMDGATQYVLLGAGLDTFAYRNPYPHLHVFEVDHPATQAWKRSLLRQHGIAEPNALTFIESDLREKDLKASLPAAGFDTSAKSVFACLGVLPYLASSDFTGLLACVGRQRNTTLADTRLPSTAGTSTADGTAGAGLVGKPRCCRRRAFQPFPSTR